MSGFLFSFIVGLTNGDVGKETNNGDSKNFLAHYKIHIITSTIILSGLIISIILALNVNSTVPYDADDGEILFGDNYERGIFPILGNGHRVVDRHAWGAATNIGRSTKLVHPIQYVMITHIGAHSISCFNLYKCSIKMRTIQDTGIGEHGQTDISANFYVTNEGSVYVGRGWNYTNVYNKYTLSICFAGDYNDNEPDPKQLDVVRHLVAYGVIQRIIASNYRLIAHNHTKSTTSPGVNVYKHIKTWPHWYPCGVNSSKPCGYEYGV